ncbi:two component transcriptional regulator, winged helix family [Noviherbaspirillum humi]|uniref:Two component transcriptional regulator, winged helix family n=1 Tax=Noviherbaspirillum humi TaxID=1688639 RepID=A0A239JAE0_9BURK|nr:response regulator transcription factor [Noviherbaspirillum humi]SNT02775.1 two component transcriptional regulator, winged helix family [Noviherbaspirillum humi]
MIRVAVLGAEGEEAGQLQAILRAEGHAGELLPAGSTMQGDRFDLAILAAPDPARWPELLRAAGSQPVLLLASLDQDRALAAAMGAADAPARDYLIRPLRRPELRARIRVLLRRAHPERPAAEPVDIAGFRFDREAGEISRGGETFVLTRKEFEVALLLFSHLGRPVSRATLTEVVWSRDADLPTRTVDTHVSRVRSKLGLRPENGFRLLPVYSYGYQLEQAAGVETA